MPVELWLAFVAASAVLLIIPGPTILTVISYSMSHGRRANVPLVAAVALGDSTALVVSLPAVKRIASDGRFTIVHDSDSPTRVAILRLDEERLHRQLPDLLVARHFGASDASE